MRLFDIQTLLAAAGLYDGGLDGVDGPKTKAAVAMVLAKERPDVMLSVERFAVAAAQIILIKEGFEPGVIDGWYGHNTREAFNAWAFKNATGKVEKVTREKEPGYKPSKRIKLPTQAECGNYYGRPGPEIVRQLVNMPAPYSMRIDWNLYHRATTIRIHKKAAPSLEKALTAVRAHYGDALLRKLGLDRYAGAYFHRRMRGGSSWSMHAYACAIDFYAEPNGLRTRCPQALFCGPEYAEFVNIMVDNGWVSLGRAIGRDWMHFQRASV